MSESSQVDGERFARKTPILDQERSGAFKIDDLDREWNLVTEATKRGFQSPDIRRALIGFVTTPVSESLPVSFLSSVGYIDTRINKIGSRYQGNLGAFLALPSMPDELLRPDLRRALFRYDSDPDYGITYQEREMVARRYRYARDVKLLALGAEMTEVGRATLQPQKKDIVTEYTLPSGVRTGLATQDKQITDDLLTPQLWEKRKQIKDRVYEITVNGKRYILKERKTARHTDTSNSGHHDGLTSEEEIAVAQKLNNSDIKEDGIRLSWEIPLGFVEFPDGFQFALFEFTEGLESGVKVGVREKLALAVLSDKVRFNAEYEQLRQGYKKFMNYPFFRDREKEERERNPKTTPLGRLLKLMPNSSQFNYEDYALVKSCRMTVIADFLSRLSLAEAGYMTSDSDVVTKVNSSGPDLLEEFTYDYEYFRKQTPEQSSGLVKLELADLSARNKKGLSGVSHLDLVFKDGRREFPVTKAHEAAYQALIALEGDKWDKVGRKILEPK